MRMTLEKLCIVGILLIFLASCSDTPQGKDEFYSVLTEKHTLEASLYLNTPPQDISLYGDTLYVLTRDSSNATTLHVLNAATSNHLSSFSEYSDSAGNTYALSEGMSLTATKNRLYICSEGSLVDVFDRSTLAYSTTIGKGNWWADEEVVLVHAFALAEFQGVVAIRDKHNIRIYNAADLTYDNRRAVPLQAKSLNLGSNNGKRPYAMIAYDSKLVATGYDERALHLFDQVQFLSSDTAIAPKERIALAARPLDISRAHGSLYVVLDNGMIEQRSEGSLDLIKTYSHFDGAPLRSPRALHLTPQSYFLIDDATEEIVQGTVEEFTFTVYEEN